MPDLKLSLSNFDLHHLKIVGEKWGIHLVAPDTRQGLIELVDFLLTPGILLNGIESLSKTETKALLRLESKEGKEPWDHFSRRFGEIREIGAGRLDRERLDLEPISVTESLWYRGLVARGFFETETGPLEFVYIPDDVKEILMPLIDSRTAPSDQEDFLCRKAAPREKKHIELASGVCLDHLCTLLAGIRMNLEPDIHLPELSNDQYDFYKKLIHTLKLVSEDGIAIPERVRDYFEFSRNEALVFLWTTWRDSADHHDLVLTPGIQIEGILNLDAKKGRTKILGLIKHLNADTWWSIESFLAQVKELFPDFQRSGGDYDSWFIKKKGTDDFLRGFNHWDDVEGALLRYLITGPFHWLGLLDLGFPGEDNFPTAFRVSNLGRDLLADKEVELPVRKLELVQIRAKGEIRMTENVPHKTRYQYARFCDWHPIKAESFYYSISPASLGRAEEQGLRVAHFLALIKTNTESIPPNILSALERWEKSGAQASISKNTILRLGSPAILKSLKKSKANRFILDQLGPTAVIIREGSEAKISEALVELGIFLDVDDQTGTQT